MIVALLACPLAELAPGALDDAWSALGEQLPESLALTPAFHSGLPACENLYAARAVARGVPARGCGAWRSGSGVRKR
jgi:hypothetical protein